MSLLMRRRALEMIDRPLPPLYLVENGVDNTSVTGGWSTSTGTTVTFETYADYVSVPAMHLFKQVRIYDNTAMLSNAFSNNEISMCGYKTICYRIATRSQMTSYGRTITHKAAVGAVPDTALITDNFSAWTASVTRTGTTYGNGNLKSLFGSNGDQLNANIPETVGISLNGAASGYPAVFQYIGAQNAWNTLEAWITDIWLE